MASDTSPRSDERAAVSLAASLEILSKMCANIVGLVAVVAGLWLAVDLFGAIYRGLTGPENARPLLKQWGETLGGDKLTVKVDDQSYPLATGLATVVVGAGCCVLTWLALGVMLAGAKIISWTSSEREAVRRVLQHALGPSGKRES